MAKKAGVELVSYQPSQTEELRERLIRANSLACEYYHYLLTSHKLGKSALEYLKTRKISSDSIEAFKLGYAPEGWDYLTRYLTDKRNLIYRICRQQGLVFKNYDRFEIG